MLTRRVPLVQAQAHRAAIGRAVRAGLSGCGFTVWPSGAAEVAPVTAAEPPSGIAADELVATLREVTGVQIGSGLGPLAGRIVRVSHLGIELFHVFGLLGAISVATRGAADRAADGPAVGANVTSVRRQKEQLLHVRSGQSVVAAEASRRVQSRYGHRVVDRAWLPG